MTILSPKEGAELRERTVTVKVRIDDKGGGIGDIRLHHNGKLVDSLGVYRLAKTETEAPRVLVAKADPSPYRTTRGTTLRAVMQERTNTTIQTAAFTPLTGTQGRTYTVTLTKGENTISISAFNGTNLVMSAPHSITIKAEIPERKPELFVLSVGNDHFANRSYNLTQAITDARDFSNTVQKLASPHYAKVHTQVLTDTTKPAILDAIHTMTTRMHPEDTFIFFSATHGRAEDDLYYLYTSEFDGDLSNPKSFLSSAELMELSKKLPALKQVVILDTCQAGALETIIAGLYDAKVSVLARALGMHIFSGTKSYQDALDNYKGNGLFTHFVLSGLQGQADANQNREVSVMELNPYLTKTVKEASRGTQEPVVRHFGEDLPLTRSTGRISP